jgi:hypothetical protein
MLIVLPHRYELTVGNKMKLLHSIIFFFLLWPGPFLNSQKKRGKIFQYPATVRRLLGHPHLSFLKVKFSWRQFFNMECTHQCTGWGHCLGVTLQGHGVTVVSEERKGHHSVWSANCSTLQQESCMFCSNKVIVQFFCWSFTFECAHEENTTIFCLIREGWGGQTF